MRSYYAEAILPAADQNHQLRVAGVSNDRRFVLEYYGLHDVAYPGDLYDYRDAAAVGRDSAPASGMHAETLPTGAVTDLIPATFQIKVLDGQRDDPWARSYVSAPSDTRIERTYLLHDLRPEVFGCGDADDSWSYARSTALLSKYGFTGIKLDTASCTSTGADEALERNYDDLDFLERNYFPHVQRSITQLTGARKVFITNSIVRRGELSGIKGSATTSAATNGLAQTQAGTPGGAHATMPARAGSDSATPSQIKESEQEYKAVHDRRPTHLKSSDNAKPARVPHMDYTPLGARRAIRRWRPDILQAAIESGVIGAENGICAQAQLDPQESESNAIINRLYNRDGKPGPRYAAYSVWRPLRPVTRDPLAMAPRRTFRNSKDLSFHPYQLKVLAAPSMQGDFLRALEAFSTSHTKSDANARPVSCEEPQWYYISNQKVDEVVVLKFFDSAALHGGDDFATEAPSVPHASPDIGDAAYGPARESIEVRCIAFW